MDTIIRNASLMSGKIVDIAIENGHIIKIEADLEQTAKTEIDAHGNLTLPAFVNGQLHACKVFWRRKLKELPAAIQSLPRFEAAKYIKASYSVDDVFSRVSEVMRLAILSGTCAIRLFADVDDASGLNALKGLLKIKETFSPYMDVQVVAFPQDGVLGSSIQGLMQEAMELGVDTIGGIPWIEKDEAEQKAHVDMCFSLAKAYNKDLHFVCDDTTNPESRTLEYIAQQTIQYKYQGRVAATQCAALSFYNDSYAQQVIQQVKSANISIFSNSQVSLVTTVENAPYPRGITRVQELLNAGVKVACAQDDIDNWYYPFGRNDMLEVAQFMTHVGGFSWEPEKVLPMVTTTPATILGLKHYGLEVGNLANLLILDAKSWHEALQFQVGRQVFLRGHLVAKSHRQEQLLIGEL
jgi:cytosine/creatinine deaminase